LGRLNRFDGEPHQSRLLKLIYDKESHGMKPSQARAALDQGIANSDAKRVCNTFKSARLLTTPDTGIQIDRDGMRLASGGHRWRTTVSEMGSSLLTNLWVLTVGCWWRLAGHASATDLGWLFWDAVPINAGLANPREHAGLPRFQSVSHTSSISSPLQKETS